jgi:hypothetical protein
MAWYTRISASQMQTLQPTAAIDTKRSAFRDDRIMVKRLPRFPLHTSGYKEKGPTQGGVDALAARTSLKLLHLNDSDVEDRSGKTVLINVMQMQRPQ